MSSEYGALYDPILGGRIFYLSARTFAETIGLLGETVSKEAAQALLWNIGQRYGLALGKKVNQITSSRIEAINMLMTAAFRSGWGRSHFYDRLDRDGFLEVVVEGCVFCDALENMEGSQCFFLAGILNGIAESLFSKRFQTRETECRAAGGAVCRFIIEPV